MGGMKEEERAHDLSSPEWHLYLSLLGKSSSPKQPLFLKVRNAVKEESFDLEEKRETFPGTTKLPSIRAEIESFSAKYYTCSKFDKAPVLKEETVSFALQSETNPFSGQGSTTSAAWKLRSAKSSVAMEAPQWPKWSVDTTQDSSLASSTLLTAPKEN